MTRECARIVQNLENKEVKHIALAATIQGLALDKSARHVIVARSYMAT